MVFLSYATFSPWNAYWRSFIFEFGMQNVWSHPWFGIGLTDEWARPAWMGPASVDNFWLVIAMRYGFPGIILLFLGFLPPLWTIGRRRFGVNGMVWRLRRAWVIVFVGLTLALATVDVWSTLFSFVFFLFGAGMWLVTTPQEAAESTAALARPNRDRPEHMGGDPQPRLPQNAAPVAPAGDRPQTGLPYSRFPRRSGARRETAS